MNLLYTIKNLINKKESTKRKFDLLCPFCLKRFKFGEIVFRATHSVEDDDEYCLKDDMLLEMYRKNMNLPPLGEIEAVVYPEKIFEENRLIIKGVCKQVKDKYGYVTKKKLCPHCHNELPATTARGPSVSISIIGSAKVGKSSFMAALLHEIKTKTAKNFEAECTASGDKYKEILKENEKKLFELGETLISDESKTGVEHISLYWRFNDDEVEPINIFFYDVNSEAMLDENYLELYAQNIRYSDGIIFLIDFLSLENIRKELKIQDYVNQRDIISNLYNDYIVKSQDMTTSIPTAIVITKSDALMYHDLNIVSSSSNIFNDFNHKVAFNLEEFRTINEESKNFIRNNDPAFFNIMETYFSNLGFFSVSSLGFNFVKGRPVKPVRIDEPYLWILYKLGYIKGV